jgi:ubiquinone/menaquinone biosynthesis C-methylase UbiE
MAISKKRSEKRNPKIENRVKTFKIKKGSTLVDYGCGPGIYTEWFSKAVGEKGMVYAVDINIIAKDYIEKIINKKGIKNVSFKSAKEYKCKLETEIADVVAALDIIHGIENMKLFLKELFRICKNNGMLIIDDGHQKRTITKKYLKENIYWKIVEETKDHIKLRKNNE